MMFVSTLAITISSLLATSTAFVVKPSPSRASSLSLAPIFDIPIADVSNAYSFAMQNYQLPTQSATAGILCGVGDVMAQANDEEEKKLNLDRLSRFIVKGLGGGIIWSNWYALNDSWSDTITLDMVQQFAIPQNYEWIAKTFTSIALEQFVACPIVYSLWDIPVPALLQGTPPSEIVPQVKAKIPGLLLENAKVWTFVNIIVYNIPIQFRVLFMSACDVFWQSVISETVAAEVEDEGSASRVIDTSLLKQSD